MSTSTLVTDGFGSFGDIAHIITLGLDIGQVVAANEYLWANMRLSEVALVVSALQATDACAGTMRADSVPVTGDMRSTAINTTTQMVAL